jgi:hypothetical protein
MDDLELEPEPIGIAPRFIWVQHRVSQLLEAINRYIWAGKTPPEEWFQELNDHRYYLKNRKGGE